MSAPTDAWAENDPLGSQLVSIVDDAMQRLERRIRERSDYGGHAWNDATLSKAGLHCLGHGSGTGEVGHLAGEFAIFDEDVVTKLFRICNANAAVPAADRNAVLLNWTLLKKFLLMNFVDGANTGFTFDTVVALANAAGFLLKVQNAGVDKFALEKDGKITTPSVQTASIINNAVTLAPTQLAGAAADATLAISETIRIPSGGVEHAYTPASANSILLIIASAIYEITVQSNAREVEMRLYVDGTLRNRGAGRAAEGSGSTILTRQTITTFALMQAPNAGPFNISAKDIASSASNVVYNGAREPGRIHVVELKR